MVAAFSNDPVLRYLFPHEVEFPKYAAVFFGHLFDKRVGLDTVWTVGRGASVAMWEPPMADKQASEESLADCLPHDVLARVNRYEDAVHAALPTGQFWYLGVLGTHPAYAGRRWGRAVMRAGLNCAAAAGMPSILETSNPINVGVYRRAGWEVVRTVTEPLPIWVMQQASTAI